MISYHLARGYSRDNNHHMLLLLSLYHYSLIYNSIVTENKFKVYYDVLTIIIMQILSLAYNNTYNNTIAIHCNSIVYDYTYQDSAR